MTTPWVEPFPLRPRNLPVIPEPPRIGEGGDDCRACVGVPNDALWHDARWQLIRPDDPTPYAGTCLLEPRRHAETLSDLPSQEQAEFAAVCGRMQDALLARSDVGRVWLNIWGDGGAHLHVWLIPRPLGEMDLRGMFGILWWDFLPVPDDAAQDAAYDDLRRRLAAP